MLRVITRLSLLVSLIAFVSVGVMLLLPRASAEGAGLTFVQETPAGSSEIVLVDVDKGLMLRLHRTIYPVDDLAWSPDGMTLYFSATRRLERTGRDLAVLDMRTGRVRWLTSNRDNTAPDVSTDGTRLIFQRSESQRTGADLYLYDLTTEEYTLYFQSEGADVMPRWSPADARRIAFSQVYFLEDRFDLMLSVEGEVQRLTGGLYPTWSPAGERIAYTHDDALFVQQPRPGSRAARIAAPAERPVWSPGGARIAYLQQNPATRYRTVGIVNPDGSHRRQVWTSPVRLVTPAWRPTP